MPNTGPTKDPSRSHLFVILTNPCSNGNNLIVPVCSATGRHDNTCLIGPGDHDFFKHLSFVFYAQMSCANGEKIRKEVIEGNFTYMGVLEEKIFARVCAGVASSVYSARKYIQYFELQSKNPA